MGIVCALRVARHPGHVILRNHHKESNHRYSSSLLITFKLESGSNGSQCGLFIRLNVLGTMNGRFPNSLGFPIIISRTSWRIKQFGQASENA